MASIWKRLQRVNKRAAKFQFTFSYHNLALTTTANWRPTKLSVVLTRRSRRVASSPMAWQPDMKNSLVGHICWLVPDNHPIIVTLFKDPRTHELEDKEWTFLIEDTTHTGKKRVIASSNINMRKYASIESTQQTFTIQIKPLSRKIVSVSLELTISCVFLREGKATDEDMQSAISLMSVNNNCDVAPLDDLEDIPDLENSSEIFDNVSELTYQLQQLTMSLSDENDLTTPLSSPSLPNDMRTLSPVVVDPLTGEEDKHNETLSNEEHREDQSINDEVCGESFEEINSLDSDVKCKMKDPSPSIESKVSEVCVPNSTQSISQSTDLHPDISLKIEDDTETKLSDEIFNNSKTSTIKQTREKNPSQLPPLKLNQTANDINSCLSPTMNSIEKTPGQDLLEWCKQITKNYPFVKVTNLTTSWRNGMAFCTIIHYFRPDLMDLSKLEAHDAVGNCRLAFDTAEALGVPRVIEPRDMNLSTIPDKLAVMTYLHQLRSHFTGNQLQLQQIGQDPGETRYAIENYDAHTLSDTIKELRAIHLSKENSFTQKKDIRNYILNESKNILYKVLSPTKEKNNMNTSPYNNYGHEITDDKKQVPVTVLNETENLKNSQDMNVDSISSTGCEQLNATVDALNPLESNKETNRVDHLPLVTSGRPTITSQKVNNLVSRHRDMSEKAKTLMDKLKEVTSSVNDKHSDYAKHEELRAKAKMMLSNAKPKSLSLDSFTSHGETEKSTSPQRKNISPIEIGDLCKSPTGEAWNFSKQIYKSNKEDSDTRHLEVASHTPLHSLSLVPGKLSIGNENRFQVVQKSYIECQQELLELEQEAIDQKASSLEKRLRTVMGGSVTNASDETEEQLLSQWFTLVNKKNALIRRQMQLNILEQENDLEKKYALLNQELRAAMSVEDWRKSEDQREREALLLTELVNVVDKRDQLVQRLHTQEIAIENDNEIERELEHVGINSKDKCSLQ